MRLGLLASVILVGCNVQTAEPDAQEKLEELVSQVSEVKSGVEFERVAQSLGHECNRQACSTHCQQEFPEATLPDETLICRWDEHGGEISAFTFGTVFSVIYLADDQVVSKDIKVIYTGP